MEVGTTVKVTRQTSPRYGLIGQIVKVVMIPGQITRVVVTFEGTTVSYKVTDLEVVE